MSVTDQDRERAGQIVEATWADFMRDQNTPFYRPTAELWATMACMALSGIACERREGEARTKAAIEAEREACAKIADQYWTAPEKAEGCDMCEVGHSISEEIRARSANSP